MYRNIIRSMYVNFFKPASDRVLAFVSLMVLLPVFLMIAISIKIDSKGPIFFKQNRLGRLEHEFLLWKFRTMTHKNRVQITQVFQGDPEITRVGGFLRRTKMDELPQLINVLVGDMAIIGPRPCVPSIRSKFDENTPFRFLVKPGLSSLAAIKGSVYLTWAEKWQYDREYVEQISINMDVKIVFNTLRIVLFGEKRLFENGDL